MHMIEVKTDYLPTSASDNKLDMRMKMNSQWEKKFYKQISNGEFGDMYEYRNKS